MTNLHIPRGLYSRLPELVELEVDGGSAQDAPSIRQSIHVGVSAGASGAAAAGALVAIVEATSSIDQASPEITAWLLETDAADGTMPATDATPLGRASIAADDDGHPVLYIVPIGSSMLIEQ